MPRTASLSGWPCFRCCWERFDGGFLEREIAEILLGLKAVSLRTDPPYKWVSGILAPIYTDNRLLLSYPAERKTVVKCLADVIKNMGIDADVIAGVAASGIPWAAWVAEKMNKPLVYVICKKKDHGKENLIMGKLKKGQRVLVIEDLISTGGSSIFVINAIREAGGIVDDCFAIFTYGLKEAGENFDKANCRLTTLSNFKALIQVASEMGYIKEEEKDSVLEWSKDPEGWGKAGSE